MPVLLRCLLTLLLVVTTAGNAWAAARMAGSLGVAAMPGHTPARVDGAATSDCHDTPASEPLPMACGGDSQHCDCLQAHSALPPAMPPGLPLLHALAPAQPLPGAHHAPRLPDPVRPPIPPLA